MTNEEDYDVVIDVLTKAKDRLVYMNNHGMGFNIMDQLRMEQIYELDQCIIMWKKHKNSA